MTLRNRTRVGFASGKKADLVSKGLARDQADVRLKGHISFITSRPCSDAERYPDRHIRIRPISISRFAQPLHSQLDIDRIVV